MYYRDTVHTYVHWYTPLARLNQTNSVEIQLKNQLLRQALERFLLRFPISPGDLSCKEQLLLIIASLTGTLPALNQLC